MKNRLLPLLGASAWILGLLLFIVGLNVHTSAGAWLTAVGSIVFLIGLGLEGIVWLRRGKDSGDSPEQKQ